MPIGASKVGALGGLVPGGSETFNASGTFTVPPGVKLVSITGVGSAGNPGTTGIPGNPGNPGTGGAGGGGGKQPSSPPGPGAAWCGGNAWAGTCGNFTSASRSGGRGGGNLICDPQTQPGTPGQPGTSGTAGSAGSLGCAGNPGQCSSGLGNNFAGGAGGNAGAAGNAGNAGGPGPGGSGGTGGPGGAGGGGGTGGGSGGPGYASPTPQGTRGGSGGGGGGAGATNSGSSACNTIGVWPPGQFYVGSWGGRGGTTANYSAPFRPGWSCSVRCIKPCVSNTGPTNQTGGAGSAGTKSQLNAPGNSGSQRAGQAIGANLAFTPFEMRCTPNQLGVALFSPYPTNSPGFPAIRSGGGGGAGGKAPPSPISTAGAGGGGGGGRGNAGNAGGCGGAGGCGTPGTPATYNCIPVTPGGCYPITVASPGGQVVISWNPQ